MKSIVLAAVLSLVFAGSASALSCKADSDAKKLAGAARTSHMTKCEKDVTAACEAELRREETGRCGKDQPHEKVCRRRRWQLIRHMAYRRLI